MRSGWILSFLLALGLGFEVRADDTARLDEVAAARANAEQAIRRDILGTHLDGGLTVADVVSAIGGADVLEPVLDHADQVGGTRWLDDQTCQLQLEVSGAALEQALLKTAEAHPEHLPMSIETLKHRLAHLEARSFLEAGTSTRLASAEELSPANAPAWDSVSESDRHAAIDAARQNAASHVLEPLRLVAMPHDKTLGDALDQPEVARRLADWMANRSITSVEFGDDLEVRVTINVDNAKLWRHLREALEQQSAVELPNSPDAWHRLELQVIDSAGSPIGRALAKATIEARAAEVVLPAQAPDWANQTIHAEATSESVGSLLHTARAAEAKADEQLGNSVNCLPLTPQLTLAQAAQKDPRLADAISHGLARARVYKVDYNSPDPGSVRVKVELNLADLWQALASR